MIKPDGEIYPLPRVMQKSSVVMVMFIHDKESSKFTKYHSSSDLSDYGCYNGTGEMSHLSITPE